jgi:hypothetical protein
MIEQSRLSPKPGKPRKNPNLGLHALNQPSLITRSGQTIPVCFRQLLSALAKSSLHKVFC